MPRYCNLIKPSANKAATPGKEKKGKPPAPPKEEKRNESGEK